MCTLVFIFLFKVEALGRFQLPLKFSSFPRMLSLTSLSAWSFVCLFCECGLPPLLWIFLEILNRFCYFCCTCELVYPYCVLFGIFQIVRPVIHLSSSNWLIFRLDNRKKFMAFLSDYCPTEWNVGGFNTLNSNHFIVQSVASFPFIEWGETIPNSAINLWIHVRD